MKKRYIISMILIAVSAMVFTYCGGGGSGGSETTVTAILSPANSATDIATGTQVTAIFSGAISDSITAESWLTYFSVKQGLSGSNLCTSVSYDSDTLTATCIHDNFDRSTEYTVLLSGVPTAGGGTVTETASVFTTTATIILGDYNADGYADILTGNFTIDSYSGAFSVFFGGADAVSASADIAVLGGENSLLAKSLSLHGDYNGDGSYDLVVGAPYDDSPPWMTGANRTYLFYGTSNSSSTITADLTFGEDEAANGFGSAVTAGDFNGDGYDDLAIGANEALSGLGKIFAYYGSASMDNTYDFSTFGQSGDELGNNIATGDFNGDGYDDLLAGSWGGRVKVYNGSSSGLSTPYSKLIITSASPAYVSAGDFNADGYSDAVIAMFSANSSDGSVEIYYGSSTGLEDTASVTIDGPTGIASNFGAETTVANFNGDAYADLFVSTEEAVDDTTKGYIYFGNAADMSTTPNVTVSGTADYIYIGAGDVNGDGLDDALVSSGTIATGLSTIKVYLGSSSMEATPSPNQTIDGAVGDYMGTCITGGTLP